MALGPDGHLYVCNNGGLLLPVDDRQQPRIEKISPTGRVAWLISEIDGRPVDGVNDITFDQHGNFYCTEPRLPGEGTVYSHVCPSAGVIFGQTDGAARRVNLDIRFPKGIAITPDASTLVVCETQTRQVHAFSILEPGVLGPGRIFAELPDGMPDGMCFDSEGNLLVCRNLDVPGVIGRIGTILGAYAYYLPIGLAATAAAGFQSWYERRNAAVKSVSAEGDTRGVDEN